MNKLKVNILFSPSSLLLPKFLTHNLPTANPHRNNRHKNKCGQERIHSAPRIDVVVRGVCVCVCVGGAPEGVSMRGGGVG